MKIAINQAISLGPAAGERRIVAGLAEAMRERGDSVRFDLDSGGIDLILLAASGEDDPDLTFAPAEAARYLRRHPRALAVQRVGGRAAGAAGAARRRLQAVNRLADHAVFAAAALIPAVGPGRAHTVVLNGADPRVFNPDLHRPWRGDGALKVVAVHRDGRREGAALYAALDALLADPQWAGRLAFTLIGRAPAGVKLANARKRPLLGDLEIAEELAAHHVYLAATTEDAGLSAAAAGLVGLPFLYRDDPLLAEYCAGYGEAVADESALGPSLRAMMKNYLMWSERAAAYPHSARATTRAYLALFDRLVADAEAITAARRSWRRRLAQLIPGFGG